tara:strand:+ start:520 stop:711 length:192 start_codon:yes stop_codon:yes gene_type:complete
MKVGDLVRISMRKTRKGMPYDDTVGIVTQIQPADVVGFTFVKAVFDIEYTFNINDLEVISESR